MARRLCALQARIAIGTKALQARALTLNKRMYTDVKVVRGRSGRGAPWSALSRGHWKITTFLAGLRSLSAPSPTGTDRRCITADFVHCPIGSGRYDRFQCRHLNIVQLQISSVCMVQPDAPDLCYCLTARQYARYLGRIYAAI